MTKEEQIEEMAKDLLNVSKKVSNIIMEETHEFLSQNHKYNSLKDFHEAHKKGRNVMEAEFLVELGYAKASEVAREIVAIIEQRKSVNAERYKGVQNEVWQAIYKARDHAYNDIKEIIEQKYTEDVK